MKMEVEKRLPDGALKERVWNLIFNDRQIEADAVIAEQDADRIKFLIEKGVEAEKHDRRVRWQRKAKVAAGWSILFLLFAAGAANAIYWPLKAHSNDYAHVDPGSVNDGAYAGIKRWFGENDAPKSVTFLGKAHDQLDGHAAWLTEWQTEKRRICVYVWGNSNPNGTHGTYARVVDCKGLRGFGG